MAHEKRPTITTEELGRAADASSTLESFLKTMEKKGYRVAAGEGETAFQKDDEYLEAFYRERKAAAAKKAD